MTAFFSQLAKVLLTKLGQPGTLDTEAEDCLLVPSKRVADSCREFMQSQYEKQGKGRLAVREVHFCVVLPKTTNEDFPLASSSSTPIVENQEDSQSSQLSIHIVLFPQSAFPIAKFFWQHTGDGISSRTAAACLDLMERAEQQNGSKFQQQVLARSRENSVNKHSQQDSSLEANMSPARTYSRNRHYSRGKGAGTTFSTASPSSTLTSSNADKESIQQQQDAEADRSLSEHLTYVEERYGRNMATIEAPRAKRALRKRIAGVASDEVKGNVDVLNRSGEAIREEDVYLYPTGMSAIYHAHQLALKVKNEKSICFGFPYLDTLKILQKWGPGCTFFGFGNEEDLDRLENFLKTETVTALFCEFPSNPLLRSPDLVKLRSLADEHNFLIIIDETIGNFVNVNVLPFADIVVSSLTKIFTGEANGMAGSLVLNSQGRHFNLLKQIQEAEYEDNFFNQNAIFLERNSRDFVQRVRRIDDTALMLVEALVQAQQGKFQNVIKKVYYPTLMSPENYNQCKRPGAGYGGLLSLTFYNLRASAAFYDSLRCAKGPSLGTNFTLASPFVILAHYGELDWAATFGVESNLIRISVGLEDATKLISMITTALLAAQNASNTTM